MVLRFLSSHKGLIYITLGNLIGAAATGAFWLLLAFIQNAHEYGKTNYEISIASLAASAALLGLNTTVTTYVAKGSNKINVQANQIILISCGVAAVTVAFFNWMLSFFVIGMAFWMMSTYELLGRKMYKQYAFVTIGARASQLLLSILLYYVLGITGIAIGFIISFFIFSQRYFISTRQFSRDFSEVKDKMKFSLNIYSFNMSNAFLLYFDKLVIAPLFPHYTASLNAMRIMSIGIIPMMIVWTLNSKFLNTGDTKYVLFGSAIYLAFQISLIFYLGKTLAVVLALIAQASFLYISDKRLEHKQQKQSKNYSS